LFVWLFAGVYFGSMELLGIDETAIENSSYLTTVVSLALIGSVGWGFPKIADFFDRHIVDRGDRRLAEAKTQILPDASEAMGADSRAPILFLRSFADDKLQVDFGRLSPMEDSEKRSFEETLVANLSSYGPVIAIAEPGLPPVPGAARAYFKTHEWQPRVLDWMNRSRLIAIVVGQTRGIQWEVEKILAHRHIGKTMLVLPPSPRHRERWSVICRLLDDTPWGQIAMQLDTALLRAAYFAPDGQVVAFTSKRNREIDYRLAVQFAAYGLLLHDRGV